MTPDQVKAIALQQNPQLAQILSNITGMEQQPEDAAAWLDEVAPTSEGTV